MVGQCSCGLDLTPGRGGLMTNWCLGSITVSTLPTPVGRLNGSILSVKLTFFSLSLSLSGAPPPQSVCLGQREAPWEFNCLVFPWSQVHYINSSGPRCILLTCRNLFLYLLGCQRGSFPPSWGREREKLGEGEGQWELGRHRRPLWCTSRADENMTGRYRRGTQGLLGRGEIRVALVGTPRRWGEGQRQCWLKV